MRKKGSSECGFGCGCNKHQRLLELKISKQVRYLVNVFTKSEGRESASSFAKATRHMLQILTYLLCDVCGSALLKAKMRRAVSWGVNCTLYGCVTWKTVNKVSDKFTASVFGVEYIS
jgi:hypothetical protein